MSIGIEDCIAMSEDGDWYAFPFTCTRAQVIGALAADSDWLSTLRAFHVKQGHVVQTGETGWWWQCEATDVGATPAWVATRR